MYGAVLALLGVGMLLGGLSCMRFGLKQVLSDKIQYVLKQMTVTPWRGLVVGIVAAALLQSSTVVSLVTIGLVSANYLTFYQSLGIILGANIGTCTTVQLMASVAVPEDYLLLIIGISLVIILTAKKLRYVFIAVTGLTFMFLGLNILTKALAQFSQMDSIIQYIVAAKHNSLYGIMGGIAITMFFQSSSAATGILMVLAEQGLIDLKTAAYIVYGNNIGSCISSVIVGTTAPLAAKRVAVAHIVLNLLGVGIFLPITNLLTILIAYLSPDFAGQIALLHTVFNILSSLAVMPFINYYANLIMFLVPHRKI